jgi:Arc/MetJ family transcription regulator
MKTTVEIADALLAEARRAAEREGKTLRAILEEGLRTALERRRQGRRFRLRKASFRGRGLQPGFATAGWPELRDAAYEGRGS